MYFAYKVTFNLLNWLTFSIPNHKPGLVIHHITATKVMAMWNCYQRVIDGGERTNNRIEAWHRQFEVTTILNYKPIIEI